MSSRDKKVLERLAFYFRENGMESPGLVKDFESKRNRVSLLRYGRPVKYIVLKEFVGRDWKKRKDTETRFLRSLKKTAFLLPGIIHEGDDFILLEYISQTSVLDILEQAETQKDTSIGILGLFKKTLKMIMDFNRITKQIFKTPYIFYDINLKNFMLDGSELFRVDFENCIPGKAHKDIGRLLAYILTYDPVFTGFKVKTVRDLIGYISSDFKRIDIEKVLEELREELTDISQRRYIDIDPAVLFEKMIFKKDIPID